MAFTTTSLLDSRGDGQEFNESLMFVKRNGICFRARVQYSLRQGTAAAKLPNRVHGSLAHERSQRMREILDISARRFAENYINREGAVLWETATQMTAAIWNMSGLTDNYLQVYALAESNRCNKIDRVKIQRHEGGILVANILD